MKFAFYNSKERKKLIDELNRVFGITEIPKSLFEAGREKIRGFSGDLTIDEVYALDRLTNIEFMGMYLFKEDLGHLRIGFDSALLFKEQISKNFVEVNKEQIESWMRGHNLDISLERGIYAVKYNGDVFGCGLSDGKHLINFVPKERRIKKS